MFVLVVGGGKVGYYLTKELVESGHEVVLMEKDRARAAQIVDELGSIVVPHGSTTYVRRLFSRSPSAPAHVSASKRTSASRRT